MAIKYVVYVDENGRMVYKDVNSSGENIVVTGEGGTIDPSLIDLAEVDVQEIQDILVNTINLEEKVVNVSADAKAIIVDTGILKGNVEDVSVDTKAILVDVAGLDGKVDALSLDVGEVSNDTKTVLQDTTSLKESVGNVSSDNQAILNEVGGLGSNVGTMMDDLTYIRNNLGTGGTGSGGVAYVKDVYYNEENKTLNILYKNELEGALLFFNRSGVNVPLGVGNDLEEQVDVMPLLLDHKGDVNETVDILDVDSNVVSTYNVVVHVQNKAGQIILKGINKKNKDGMTLLGIDHAAFSNAVADGILGKDDLGDLGIEPTSINGEMLYGYDLLNAQYFEINGGLDYYLDMNMEVMGSTGDQIFKVRGEIHQDKIFEVDSYNVDNVAETVTFYYTSTRDDVEILMNGFPLGPVGFSGELSATYEELGVVEGETVDLTTDVVEISTGSVLDTFITTVEIKVGSSPAFTEPASYDSTILPLYSMPTQEDVLNLGVTASDPEDGDVSDRISVMYYDAFEGQPDVYMDVQVSDLDGNTDFLYLNFPNEGFRESGRTEFFEVLSVDDITEDEIFVVNYATYTNDLMLDKFYLGGTIGEEHLPPFEENGSFVVEYGAVEYTGTETGTTIEVDVYRKGTNLLEEKKVIQLT